MLINKKTLEYLAELSRIELDLEAPAPKGGRGSDRNVGEKMLKDLQSILGHFDELKEVGTEGVEPLAGGTVEKNAVRNDEATSDKLQSADNKRIRDNIVEAFPEKEGDYLKVPPVFE